MRNLAISFLVFTLAVFIVIGIGAQQGHQGQRSQKYEDSMKASREALDKKLPIVDYDEPKPVQSEARERRLAKDRRHNIGGRPPIEEGMTETSTVYHWPEDFPALPVEQSTTIVLGKVSQAKAHISADKTGVYSEVIVEVEKVLKDKAGIASTLVAEREGGRVKFPSGSMFRYFVDGLGIPEVGSRYVLFLKRLEDGDFSIITGYELRDGRVHPLDHSSVVPFGQYKDLDENQFVTDILDLLKK